MIPIEKSFCVLDSDQIGEKYEVSCERNPCDTLGGIDQFCYSFRGWDCQPEETAVLCKFLTFFGTGLTHLTHIYGYDMDILRRNRPQLSFPDRSEATNILVHPWEGLPPPTQLTNPNNKSQLSRAINYRPPPQVGLRGLYVFIYIAEKSLQICKKIAT